MCDLIAQVLKNRWVAERARVKEAKRKVRNCFVFDFELIPLCNLDKERQGQR